MHYEFKMLTKQQKKIPCEIIALLFNITMLIKWGENENHPIFMKIGTQRRR